MFLCSSGRGRQPPDDSAHRGTRDLRLTRASDRAPARRQAARGAPSHSPRPDALDRHRGADRAAAAAAGVRVRPGRRVPVGAGLAAVSRSTRSPTPARMRAARCGPPRLTGVASTCFRRACGSARAGPWTCSSARRRWCSRRRCLPCPCERADDSARLPRRRGNGAGGSCPGVGDADARRREPPGRRQLSAAARSEARMVSMRCVVISSRACSALVGV